MALNGQHNNTLFNLENTRCRLLLLEAKEDHNATLMLIKMKCKFTSHGAHGHVENPSRK